MKKEDEIGLLEKRLETMSLERANIENQSAAAQLASQQQFLEDKEPGMIKEQLDLGEDRVRIDFLIRSYTSITDPETGEEKWVEPKDDDMILFSPYGVHVFREAVAWYLTKMTLLSNYEPEQIMDKMRDYAHSLNNLMFMSYEKIFHIPSIERCREELDKRIAERIKVRLITHEMAGSGISEEQIKREVIKEFEPTIEKELLKIRRKLLKDKYKRFSTILRFIQDIVHSAYQRAMGGQERRSLRQHMQVTETKGGYSEPPKTGGLFKWGRK